jgi:hypothetical protein
MVAGVGRCTPRYSGVDEMKHKAQKYGDRWFYRGRWIKKMGKYLWQTWGGDCTLYGPTLKSVKAVIDAENNRIITADLHSGAQSRMSVHDGHALTGKDWL